ncbi:helix-turn-helix transcriptional regulator [Bartonella tribocorum]|uniref:helix-turn-helix transcriptional regulator n=1 Tax=Bartonella tribocorum TaxID=85701 RepID=UPI0002E10D42|nr:helix-turn-helix domain-containing protein [Bartonella tribocorum]CDO48091.1 putative transcriptional regulator [Bartonella tribocorum]
MNTEEKLKIKSIRKCLSLTQKELADLLDVKQASVCRWEQGKGLSLKSYLKLQKLKDSSSSMSAFIAASTDNNKHPQHHSHS